VVSDTSPLHYLILCGAERILPELFQQVVIPPTVFAERQQTNARLDAKLIQAVLQRHQAQVKKT